MSTLQRHYSALEHSRTLQRIAYVIDEVPVSLDTEARAKAAILATVTPVLRDIDDGRLSGSPAAEARLSALIGVALSIIAAGPRPS
ncbi:hypothetical protein [Thiocapsa roseopersicina]|uniref:Uncharacterized protein n=1 Tax=Thiocapsa roseopersicina TaxID=1058 RepID=A0A1H3DQ73_THIRO|nr:hypothetical protein [Thiocapsa roseopersicina]SDX68565.1 hypothetical protein SAMN05421783_15511 [Thiocapsa roseopersicina]